MALRITLCLFLVALLIGASEIILRIVDFRHESHVSFGALRPECEVFFVPDRELYWKYRPNSTGINSLGFRGEEIAIPKPNKVKRLLFLGDSCTDQNFARYVKELLNRQFGHSGTKYECVILAAPGYSSYQGAILAQKFAKNLEADLGIVYFGWNDHWLAFGAPDKELEQSVLDYAIGQLYHSSRLLQFGRKLLSSLWTETDDRTVVQDVRVSPIDFAANLKTICNTFTQDDIPIVFVTPPSSHEATGVPEYLVEKKLAISKESVLKLHRKYCDTIRTVANECGAALLDLESELGRMDRINDVFQEDGIHFTDFGKQLVGFMIYEYLKKEVLVYD